MRDILYKLAIWYIGRYNARYDYFNMTKLTDLNRLTYRVGNKSYLLYGGDEEWKKMSRYSVIQNAINKLAELEDTEEKQEKYFQKKVVDNLTALLNMCDRYVIMNRESGSKYPPCGVFLADDVYNILNECRGEE